MGETVNKTVPSTVFIIGIVAAVGAVTYAMGSGKPKPDFEDERTERVTVAVNFDPNQRPKAPVHIMLYVDNTMMEDVNMKSSPWSKTITVPKGAQVSVQANQETGGPLSCTILVDGRQVDVSSRKDAGSIRCWHNRKK